MGKRKIREFRYMKVNKFREEIDRPHLLWLLNKMDKIRVEDPLMLKDLHLYAMPQIVEFSFTKDSLHRSTDIVGIFWPE